MHIDELPKFIRESTVLDENEKSLLSQIDELPSDVDVEIFGLQSEILELTNAFIGDESTKSIHLQTLAKVYLQNNDILSAWKIILQ